MNIRGFENRQPAIAASAYVDEAARIIGDVTLGEDVSVWPTAVLRGDIHSIVVGARTNIQDGTVVHVTHDSEYNPGGHGVELGADITVGHRVVLHGCRVGDGCLIGMGSTIMDGAVIEAGVMLGAASLVPPGKQLQGGYLWMGSPARKVRALSQSERDYLRYSASHYVQLKNRYQAGLQPQ